MHNEINIIRSESLIVRKFLRLTHLRKFKLWSKRVRVTFRWGFARLLQVTHQLKGTMQYDNDVTWEMIFQMFTMNVPPLEWGAIDVFAHVSEIEES